MPSLEFDFKRKAYIKECSCCGDVIVGASTQDASYEIFLKHFAESNGSAQTADGLQSRCWACNSSKRRQLGITRQVLETMWSKQGGKCAICEKKISIVRNAPTDIHAHVDHDEETGIVRELLCGNCNRGIGLFKHNKNVLFRAAEYVHYHKVVVPIRRKA